MFFPLKISKKLTVSQAVACRLCNLHDCLTRIHPSYFGIFLLSLGAWISNFKLLWVMKKLNLSEKIVNGGFF